MIVETKKLSWIGLLPSPQYQQRNTCEVMNPGPSRGFIICIAFSVAVKRRVELKYIQCCQPDPRDLIFLILIDEENGCEAFLLPG